MVKKSGIENVTDHVWILHDRMLPLYVIRSEKNFLIDCSVMAKAPWIEKNLIQFLKGEKIDSVLLTHSHYDHVGACSRLQEKFHFNIMASQRTKEILENPDAIEFIDRMNREFQKILRTDSPGSTFTRPQDIIAVQEGDRIPVSAEKHIQVYETPGHTRCSLSFLLEPEKILFVGDASGVMEKTGINKPLFLSSYVQYEASLQKIIGLKVRLLALPHNSYIQGTQEVDDYLTRSLQAARSFKKEILEALEKSTDYEKIAQRILAREFTSPTLMGPKEAMLINVMSMVRVVHREFGKKSAQTD